MEFRVVCFAEGVYRSEPVVRGGDQTVWGWWLTTGCLLLTQGLKLYQRGTVQDCL